MEDQGGPGYWGSYKYQDKINILINNVNRNINEAMFYKLMWVETHPNLAF